MTKLPDRLAKHLPPANVSTFHSHFVQPLLHGLLMEEVEIAQLHHVTSAVTLLIMLLDDPDERRYVLEQVSRTINSSFN
jgi:hypothetical protein